MDGASQTAGVATVVLGGRTLFVKSRDIEFYGLLEAEILRLRGDPLSMVVEAAKNLADHPQAAFLVDQVANTVANRFRNWRLATYTDYSEFFNTPHGDAFQLWLCVRHNDPSPSQKQVEKWLWDEINRGGIKRRDEIMNTIEIASGEDPLGNSAGPSTSTTTGGPV